MVVRRMMGPSLETDAVFRCCTVGELLQDGDSVSVMTVQEKCDEKSLGAASGHRKVTCRQFGTAPLRLSLRAGFLEKREKGRTPSYFVSVLKTNPRYTFRVEVAHPPEGNHLPGRPIFQCDPFQDLRLRHNREVLFRP